MSEVRKPFQFRLSSLHVGIFSLIVLGVTLLDRYRVTTHGSELAELREEVSQISMGMEPVTDEAVLQVGQVGGYYVLDPRWRNGLEVKISPLTSLNAVPRDACILVLKERRRDGHQTMEATIVAASLDGLSQAREVVKAEAEK